jgi:hypothetical protein
MQYPVQNLVTITVASQMGALFFFGKIKFDDLVKSQGNDGFVKSSRCKARKN